MYLCIKREETVPYKNHSISFGRIERFRLGRKTKAPEKIEKHVMNKPGIIKLTPQHDLDQVLEDYRPLEFP